MARHRVQVLRAGGKTLRRIAAETGISLRSVKRIVRESSIAAPAGARACGVGRPSRVEAYGDRIAAVLAAEPKLPHLPATAWKPCAAACGGTQASEGWLNSAQVRV